MRTIKIVLTLILLSKFSWLPGQSSYAPLGAYWNYGYTSHNGGLQSNWTIKVNHDTLINGFETKTLTKLYDNWYSLPPNPPVGQGIDPYGTLQLRNDSVFFFYSFPTNGMFLYSFNMAIGDTIHIFPPPQNLYAVVDTLYQVIINNDTLTQWKLTKYCNAAYFGDATIVENIGPVDDYLLWNTDGCPIGGGWWTFQCYSSSILNYNQPCDPIPVGISSNDLQQNLLTVFPAPAQNNITIETGQPVNDARLKIFNSSMQVVLQRSYPVLLKESIDLSKLAAGQYFLQISSNELTVTRKIILTER
jgi:hypothetical protein